MENYEQKYKEMKKRVLAIGQGYVKEVDYNSPRSIAEYIDPELRESKDERIRKELIQYLKDYPNLPNGNYCRNDFFSWLEKQGEQKSEVKYVYTKFRIGDVIVEIKPNGYCQPVRVKYVGEGAYSCKSDDGKRSLSFPIISQDKYKLVEQKAAWSEEDENMLNSTIKFVESSPFSTIGKGRKNVLAWLKSLKPHWKPSEEQMKHLKSISVGWHPSLDDCRILSSLYNDLKNL